MTRVLFVDDEPHILAGLRRLLRDQRNEWDMAFAAGGQEALEQLRAAPFDVVVTDMRMPGMDGATLLARVKEEFPGAARIILSGHSEPAASLRAATVAHRFLSKPCDAAVLKEAIAATCALQGVLRDPALQAVVAEMHQLPSVPQVYAELSKALADPDVALRTVAGIIEKDIAMSAKILQLANSAFFSLPKRVTSVGTAITSLGTATLRSLVLSVEVFEAFEKTPAIPQFSLEVLQRHALVTAALARRLAPSPAAAEDAYMAGLLHDVGILVLATRLPDRFAELLAKAGDSPLATVEQSVGVSHGQLGAYLLGLWGIPTAVVEAVALHHTPRSESRQLDLPAIVYLANVLAHEHAPPPGGGEAAEPLDPSFVEALGIAERLPDWRELAKQAATGGLA